MKDASTSLIIKKPDKSNSGETTTAAGPAAVASESHFAERLHVLLLQIENYKEISTRDRKIRRVNEFCRRRL